MEASSRPELSFWRWLTRGTGAGAGLRRLVDAWLPFHFVVGGVIAQLVSLTIREAANAVLLPLAGILIGLTFAWAGNAQALLQASEIEDLSEKRKGGFEEYVFTFQLAVLILLATLVAWGLGGLGVFERQCFWPCSSTPYFVAKALLFALASLALRECWHVVVGAQVLLLVRRRIRSARKPPGGAGSVGRGGDVS